MLNKKRMKIIREKVNTFNRINLANLPTPLMELPNFSQALGGPKIYMKRDDLTGCVAFGGNKTRMLEFRLAPAVEQKADIVVCGAAIQSNHVRQTAVAARKLGMEARIILRKIHANEKIDIQGNLLIDFLTGSQIKIVEATQREQVEIIHQETRRLKQEGRNPFETGIHDTDLSAIAYVSCSLEMIDQMTSQNIKPSYIYVASEGATQAGLVLFAKYTKANYSVVGINMVDWIPDIPGKISTIANLAATKLGIDCSVQSNEVINYSEYLGKGYGEATTECINAIKLLAQTEGILADPVYVGKGLAGLIDHIKKGKLKNTDVVVFLHTGGAPNLFCYKNIFRFEEKIKI